MDDKKGFSARFRAMSDQELIEDFNREVGNDGWVSARAAFLAALHDEFNNREYDYAIIGCRQGLSFARKVRLEGKRIVLQDV